MGRVEDWDEGPLDCNYIGVIDNLVGKKNMKNLPFRSPTSCRFFQNHSVLLSLIAAKRVARRRNHRLQNSSLRVQLLLDPESSNTEDEDGPNSVSIVVTISHQKMCKTKTISWISYNNIMLFLERLVVGDVSLVVWLSPDWKYHSKLIHYKLLLAMVTDNLYNKLRSYQFCSPLFVL